MPSIKEMLLSVNKGLYLLEQTDEAFYAELDRTSREVRQALAKELVNERHRYPFFELISRLTDICFQEKGATFIRFGSADILGEILKQLVVTLDGHQITDIKFLDNYQADEEVSILFAMIYDKARARGEAYEAQLPQNIANKIYNNILVDKVEPSELMSCGRALQAWVQDKDACNSFFYKMVDQEQLAIKRAESIRRILDIKEKLKGPWDSGWHALFQTPKELTIDGSTCKLPDKLLPLANTLLSCERDEFKNPRACIRSLQQQAATALKSPHYFFAISPRVRKFMIRLLAEETPEPSLSPACSSSPV